MHSPNQRSRRRQRRTNALAFGFLSPSIVLMVVLFGIPIALAIALSFSDYNPFSRTVTFVGFDNFAGLVTGGAFWNSVILTVIWTVVSVVIEFTIALSIALLLHRITRGSRVFRTIFGLPWAVPPVFAALIWATMLDPTSGGLNLLLRTFGITDTNIAWLGDSKLVLPSLIVVTLWKFTPFMILTLLAGLKAIDEQVYEAAALDGSTGFRTFRHITFPLLLPVTVVVITLATLWRAKHFDIVWTLTHGGPGTSSDLLAIRAFKETVINLDAGAGSAVAVLLSVALIGFILVMSRRLMRGL